jgi:hypothetical protein
MVPYIDKYQNKYLKYKNKYLELCNNLKGGSTNKIIVLDGCIQRQFTANPSFSGTQILNKSPEEFTCKINDMLKNNKIELTEGKLYQFAPHIFIDKDTLFQNGLDLDLVLNDIPITKDLQGFIKSQYVSRNEKEIKTLMRWIEKNDIKGLVTIPKSEFIDIVLYTKEHLLDEIDERITKKTASKSDFINKKKLSDPLITHGVVKIIGMLEKKETPIDPFTMVRNHLGMEYGGNGEKIDLVKYQESIDYWNNHILLQQGKS